MFPPSFSSPDRNFFPSFAPSPEVSPPRGLLLESGGVQKITIDLPESFVESSTEDQEGSLSDSQPALASSALASSAPLAPSPCENIRVYCRFRPSEAPSQLRHDESMVDDGENRYSFDGIFGRSASQEEVFRAVAGQHVESFLRGQNSTVFTYGQTGSGKTFTMFGSLKEREQYGLIPRALELLFARKEPEDSITCSILEIYNEKLIDLFDPLKQAEGVRLKEVNEAVVLEGLVEVRVDNHHELMDLIRFGYKDRKIAATYNNDSSSRSHTILFVYRLHCCHEREYRTKLCFIDLAGSEKIRKSGVKGQNLEETKKINLSLSCLGNVVSALTSGADHVPYRNSKLTRILKDSLSGGCRTSIITTCSLDRNDVHETLSTIKFAVRAKRIKNKKRLTNHQDTPEEVIASLRRELAQTKKELDYYKRKELPEEGDHRKKERPEEVLQAEEIPEEAVVSRPIKLSTFSGAGLRTKHFSSTYL